MAEKTEKQLSDVNTFVANMNKKSVDARNGKKIHFAFTNRKRKG